MALLTVAGLCAVSFFVFAAMRLRQERRKVEAMEAQLNTVSSHSYVCIARMIDGRYAATLETRGQTFVWIYWPDEEMDAATQVWAMVEKGLVTQHEANEVAELITL